MKKPTKVSAAVAEQGLHSEYKFDYRKAKPNRFAEQFGARSIAVVLDPDVAEIFRTSEAVNALLRSVISALPRQGTSRRGPKRSNPPVQPAGSARG